MKRLASCFILILTLLLSLTPSLHAQQDPEPVPEDGEGVDPQPSYRPLHYYNDDGSGWFIGSDQGAWIFVGRSDDLISTQYYSTLFGGYNFKGLVQPMFRLGSAVGNISDLYAPRNFFFTFEAAVKVTPLKTKVRPYMVASAGLYVLDFEESYTPLYNEANFTYSVGAGLEVALTEHNLITLGSSYRGFINQGPDLQAVEITAGYSYQF